MRKSRLSKSPTNSSPTGYTGYNDHNGTPIKIGDKGEYALSSYQVTEVIRGNRVICIFQKWCENPAYDIPLTKESAKRFIISRYVYRK